MPGLILIATLVIIIICVSKSAQKARKMEGLEQAIIRSHRENNWDIAHNYCIAEGISGDTLAEYRDKVILQLAEEGDLEAMQYMALHAQSSEMKCKWYTRCAKSGDVDAMYTLGLRYSEAVNLEGNLGGYGCDPQQSFYWYMQAAEHGHSSAVAKVASCYYFGDGVAEDKNKAFELATEFWDRGNSECGLFLVNCFYTKEDPATAIKILERILTKGDPEKYWEAALTLGHIFGRPYLNPGVPIDDFSDRRKATYCFVLAYVASGSDAFKSNVLKTGYDFTEFEYKRWFDDAKNLRYNPM